MSARGKHSLTVYLTAGRWSFSAGTAGKKTYFTVS